jgi:ketosteroid isomerase-like protein
MAQSAATDIREAIVAANAQLVAAFSQGDAAGVAASYTENAQVLPPNSDVIAGQTGIQTFWQGAMHMGIKAVKLVLSRILLLHDFRYDLPL